MTKGPLSGVRVVEFAGIGPAPFCCMLLADMGADVIRIERPGTPPPPTVLDRGRRVHALDLKRPESVQYCLKLIETADVLVEGFRPGVMERLGLDPDICLKRNPLLIYGRMTGWGQNGPLSSAPGHDINYIALSGALHAIGKQGEPPVPPLSLVGDFGGGALYLALGICAALIERNNSGKGQIIDAAMVDGVTSLMSVFLGAHASGEWVDRRESNLVDGGAPFYRAYETSDGKYISIGSIEPQFYATLRNLLGLGGSEWDDQMDQSRWPERTQALERIFRGKTRDEWCALLQGEEVCFAPVLSLNEVAQHPHNAQRGSLVEIDGVMQPNPAPRFSRTPSRPSGPPVFDDRLGAANVMSGENPWMPRPA